MHFPQRSVAFADSPVAVALSDRTIFVDCTLGPVVLNLPTAVGKEAFFVEIKKDDATANAMTINATGGQTIDGAPSLAVVRPQVCVGIISDNANYKTIYGSSLSGDIYAATRVVSLIAGDGTDLTIAAAVAALPAEGGRIYVKQGTYPAVATQNMPDKSVDVVGSGDGTIISLGTHSVPAFTIPDGLTAPRTYTFGRFKVTASDILGSGVLSVQDTHAFGRSVVQNVRSEGIHTMIEIAAGDVGFVTPVLVDVYDSWFVPSDFYFLHGAPVCSNCAVLCTTDGNSLLNKVTMKNVNFMVDEFSTVGGSINGDSFGSLDISFYDCMLALAGEDGLNSIRAYNSRIWNFNQPDDGSDGDIIFLGGLAVSADDLPESVFIGCELLGLLIDDSGGMAAVGGFWTNTSVSTALVNGQSTITGVSFRGDATSAAVFPLSSGLARFIFGVTEDLTVSGCMFSSSGNVNVATAGPIDIYVDAQSSCHLSNCEFRALTASSTAGVRFTGSNNSIGGGSNFDNVWACPPVLESGGANFNRYDDVLGLNGGTGGTGSTFIGLDNTYNGSCMRRVTGGNTTDLFVSALPAGAQPMLNPGGLVGVGTIKNTGANDMNVKEIVTDAFGVTDSQTIVVGAGGSLLLDTLLGNVTTARPPYVSYDIQVQSKTAGMPTTYSLRLTANPELTAF
jgi:hypothetical protein